MSAPATIDSYLTGKAAAVWPAALVVRVETNDGTRFILQRPGHDDVGLGFDFGSARRSLYAAIKHQKAGGSIPG